MANSARDFLVDMACAYIITGGEIRNKVDTEKYDAHEIIVRNGLGQFSSDSRLSSTLTRRIGERITEITALLLCSTIRTQSATTK